MDNRPHYWMSSRTLRERLKYLETPEAAFHYPNPEELERFKEELATELLTRRMHGWG